MEFNKLRLDEICSVITDGSHSSPKSVENGYPMASVKDMTYSGLDLNSCRKVSKEDYEALIKNGCKPQINDVLIAKDGSYLKHISVVKKNEEVVLLSSIAILRPDLSIINPDFLKYYLLNPVIKDELEIGYVSGSVIRRIVLKDFRKFEVNIPNLETQEKIASILSALDDKIEINNEMNKTLEEMAQTLFKRWFIDFDFPNENGEPYRSSGGKMVDSELGEIPEGWEIGKIGDLIRVQNGYAFKSKDFLEKGTVGIIKIKNISDRKVDINKSDFISEELAEAIDKKFFIQSSSILIAMTGAEVGKIGIVPEHNKKLYLNQRVGKFEELINGGKEFSYFYLNKEETQELIIAKSAGSAQPNISSKGIEELKIVLPSIKLLSEFEKNIGKSLKKIALNLNEINTLIEIRDTLLPKFMGRC